MGNTTTRALVQDRMLVISEDEAINLDHVARVERKGTGADMTLVLHMNTPGPGGRTRTVTEPDEVKQVMGWLFGGVAWPKPRTRKAR